LGLQRRDIDLLHGTVRVNREAQEITGQGRILTAPKSEAGDRSVELPPPTQAELSHHMDAYVAPEPDAYVFTRPSGRPLRRSDLSNAWHAACAVVGIDGVHPHDLRHFAGTTTARMPGITTKELMSRMGHASPRAALIYQHATQERDRVVADYLGERSSIEVASPTEISLPSSCL
jgi:integrase